MTSLNIAVFSDNPAKRIEIASAIAKKNSEDDLGYYSTVFQGKVISVVEPKAFPEKPQTALFAANLADYCVLAGSELGPRLGELIAALDLLGKTEGALVSDSLDWGPLVKGTALEGWKRFSSWDEAKDAVLSFEPVRQEGPPWGIVDHAFEIKGIGSVALGALKRGSIRVHDKLMFFPPGLECEVRSIQVHDADVEAAVAGDRFGACFKGCASKDVERGFVIAAEAGVAKDIEVELEAPRFLREPVKNGEVLHACIGLQFVTCKTVLEKDLAGGERRRAKISCETPVAWTKGDNLVLVRLNAKGLRFVAKARL
ncbi:MAG: hypothetical protein NTY90_03910 [Candidatus Micrarchaeota archaeon]|nr:hypothetical protein [Candidatus Micrarchaeota archaeon]